MNEDAAITLDEFWESVGDRPYGCTPQQVAYVKAVLAGATGSAAAIAAGYSEKHAAVQASRLKTNPKVRALLNAALQAKEVESNELVAPDELLKLWSREARYGENSQSRVKAQEMLARYHSLFDGGSDIERKSDTELLDSLCNEHPVLISAAIVYADALSVGPHEEDLKNWRPPIDRIKRLHNYPAITKILVDSGYGRYLHIDG